MTVRRRLWLNLFRWKFKFHLGELEWITKRIEHKYYNSEVVWSFVFHNNKTPFEYLLWIYQRDYIKITSHIPEWHVNWAISITVADRYIVLLSTKVQFFSCRTSPISPNYNRIHALLNPTVTPNKKDVISSAACPGPITPAQRKFEKYRKPTHQFTLLYAHLNDYFQQQNRHQLFVP